MKIHIILRTHDGQNVHNDWRIRYCNLPKCELIMGCYRSLLKSIEYAVKNRDWSIKLTVLDDHSSQRLINFISQETTLNNYELVQLDEHGYNYSALKQFELCRDSDYDLVYSVEDDYLHCETAILEMIDSYTIFKNRIPNSTIVIYPFDTPEEYNPPTEKDFIVHGSHRHWRTGKYTTNVMMSTPEVFNQHWSLFEVLAKEYNGDYLTPLKEGQIRYTEENTIWNIWKQNHAIRFNPIPSLALHMQFDQQIDPFISWQDWWNKYA